MYWIDRESNSIHLHSVCTLIRCGAFVAALAVTPVRLPAQSYVHQWAWIGGHDTQTFNASFGWPGVYGEKGHFLAANLPSARESSVSWTDMSGRLWLFGGFGSDSTANYGYLNDLWVFDPSRGAQGEWAWMSGNSTIDCLGCGRPAVHGSKGQFAAANNPGGRSASVGWTDSNGKLWLFGGSVSDSNYKLYDMDDLWVFDPSQGEWAWMGGTVTIASGCATSWCGQSGVYGTEGQFTSGNIPGARDGAVGVVDANGNFWLFAGGGFDQNGTFGELNDLWEFDPAKGSFGEWAWFAGSPTIPRNSEGQSGIYGEQGTFAAANVPGCRVGMVMWIDLGEHLWVFGGIGYDSTTTLTSLNDLWEFDPARGGHGEWAWMAGSSVMRSSGQPGTYGKLGQYAESNVPGARHGSLGWSGGNGTFSLFGGQGFDSALAFGDMNDQWLFDPTRGAHGEWAWIDGTSVLPATCKNCGQPGSYGPLGQFSESNDPGGRDSGVAWRDLKGNTWVFGGGGFYDSIYQAGELDDLWEYKRLIAQTIQFHKVPISLTYGAKPLILTATGGGSGNPIVFSVISGPGEVSGKDGVGLKITGAGRVEVGASQAGNSDFAAAPQVSHLLSVGKASLTFSANNLEIKFGGAIPTPTYTTSGLVNEDKPKLAFSGKPTFFIAGGSKPGVGTHAITISIGTLQSSNYKFAFKSGTLTVLPLGAAAEPKFSPAGGTYGGTQMVSISDSTRGASLYYTTNGTTPSATHGKLYKTAFTVASSETVKAIAVETGYTNSAIATAHYTIP